MKKLLVFLLIAAFTLSSVGVVMAAESPTAEELIKVDNKGKSPHSSGNGKVSITPSVIVPGEKVNLSATPQKGSSFSKWIIKGPYKIVSGSLKDGNLVIIPLGDVKIYAEFIKKKKPGQTEAPTEKPTKPFESSNKSPQTGMNTAAAGVALMMFGAFAVAVVTKKKAFK